ncbi:hypothetical protein GCM10009668_20080 [Nocardioides dubius]|uniref:Uncharacterized protein n=1 Tax=Nocardioides dubius TaxID=317019 RepID=A0ABN1TVN3_9ACTN
MAAAGERLAAGPLDADHVGAEVGEHHAGMGAGADSGDLHDLDAAQRASALTEFESHAAIVTDLVSELQGRPTSNLFYFTVTRATPAMQLVA